jgi:membrane-associated phospholipid phosphatase
MINKFGGTFLEKIFLWTYDSLFPIISALLIISFLFKKDAFRKFVLSFFISWIIAYPIWFLFPTLSPDLMFRLNSLNMSAPRQTLAFNDFKPSPQFTSALTLYEGEHIINIKPNKERILPTSTFPSMHAAWGLIVAYAGIIISPWIGLILVPWAILNGISAVYVLEHFSIDIFLGSIVAMVAIIITELLFRFEKRYFEDKFELLSGFDYIKSFFKKFLK